ncbi:hypothetical protein E6O75_ATG10860 [Venturia nashicola]|uniref:CARD domain-containing protein n=1 Tax=Venturia nashicola TaxID=86259 RepID=A0A4Z1PAK7_9PEZI|nr:hypothetical protein E6O75_ATG10860 [Venturia nashicola]
MAFRQPQQRPQHARQLSYASGEQAESSAPLNVQRTSTKHSLEDEEWVLFSPSAPSTTQTATTSTDRTPRTAGLSRLSDFGSLDTAARSDHISGRYDDNATEQGTEADEEGELDSLDDGLHAFHEPPDHESPRRTLERSGETEFPSHNGLGLFGDASNAMQAQLWQYERESRRKIPRRASSVQRTLEALKEEEEISEENEKIRRVEKWRLEQSRALLDEIERESRRMRRMSRANSMRSLRIDNFQTKSETNFSSVVTTPIIEEPAQEILPEPEAPEEDESFWTRVTRRVIRSLIGIDEELLSVILGESLHEDARKETELSIPDLRKDATLEDVETPPILNDSWEHRLLDRVARELGILVNQLSGHPGAFATYLRTQETPAYAGLPNTTNTTNEGLASSTHHQSKAVPNAGLFAPTITHQPQSDPSLWGIEEEAGPENALSSDAAQTQADREYWERELDVKMVFKFLKSRFSSRPSSPEPEIVPYAGGGDSAELRRSSVLSNSTQRAALIRQHHPLVSRNSDAVVRRRPSGVVRNRLVPGHGRTGSSSCKSLSTKISRKSGSSRNYWDIGGSVGSGHASGLGGWGEV